MESFIYASLQLWATVISKR